MSSDAIRDLSPQSTRPTTRECMLVALLLVVGIGLRFAYPSRMAVEHFDEGVYASNIWFGPDAGYAYPMRRFYAPPLLPSAIEWSIIVDTLRGDSSASVSLLAPILPSLIAGCVTLFLLWKMTREWFGPTAGIATLTLATLSDFHSLYSRTALTESLMLLFFIAAVWMMKRAFSTSSYTAIGLASLFTGLTWWTKYNGWLPLAVGLGGLVVAFVVDAPSRKNAPRLIVIGISVVVIAFAVWTPYLLKLQSFGGYAEVAANHRQYAVGFSGWMSSCWRQYANLSHFDGWASYASLGVAVLVAGWNGRTTKSLLPMLTIALTLVAASVWLSSALVMFLLALWCVANECRRRWFDGDAEQGFDFIALSCLAAWIGGLFLATPLYHPYPRLTLPWLAAIWMGAGFGIERLIVLLHKNCDVYQSKTVWRVVWLVSVVAIVVALPHVARKGWPAWQSRTGWLSVANQIVEEVDRRTLAIRGNRNEAVVLVFGEPGLFYQLNVRGTQAFGPVADLSFAAKPQQESSVPVFLVTGPHAERTSGFQEEFSRYTSRLKLVAEYDYQPSDLVLLNQAAPWTLKNKRAADQSERVMLYQVVH